VLSLNFAQLLGPRGITANIIVPGSVPTDMNPPLKTEEGRNFVVSHTALGRSAVAKDMTDVVVFLASDDSRWVTTQYLFPRSERCFEVSAERKIVDIKTRVLNRI